MECIFKNHIASNVFYSGMNCVPLVILLFARQIKTTYLLKLDALRAFNWASYRTTVWVDILSDLLFHGFGYFLVFLHTI